MSSFFSTCVDHLLSLKSLLLWFLWHAGQSLTDFLSCGLCKVQQDHMKAGEQCCRNAWLFISSAGVELHNEMLNPQNGHQQQTNTTPGPCVTEMNTPHQGYWQLENGRWRDRFVQAAGQRQASTAWGVKKAERIYIACKEWLIHNGSLYAVCNQCTHMKSFLFFSTNITMYHTYFTKIKSLCTCH